MFTFTRGDTLILPATWTPGTDGPATLAGLTLTSALIDRAGGYHPLTVTVAVDNLSLTAQSRSIIAVSSTTGLTVGMTVTGPGITGTATIVSVLDATRLVLSQVIANATNTFTYGGSATLSSTSTQEDTSRWPTGAAQWDLKMLNGDGVIKHSQMLPGIVVERVTR